MEKYTIVSITSTAKVPVTHGGRRLESRDVVYEGSELTA